MADFRAQLKELKIWGKWGITGGGGSPVNPLAIQ